MDLASARGSRPWDHRGTRTRGRGGDAHPLPGRDPAIPRLPRLLPATPGRSVSGPLLPPLRAAGKHSPAPVPVPAPAPRGTPSPAPAAPRWGSRSREGRLRGGRCSLLLEEPGTWRVQPLLLARDILPVGYKGIMSRNSPFSALSLLRSDARDRRVMRALSFPCPELAAWEVGCPTVAKMLSKPSCFQRSLFSLTSRRLQVSAKRGVPRETCKILPVLPLPMCPSRPVPAALLVPLPTLLRQHA